MAPTFFAGGALAAALLWGIRDAWRLLRRSDQKLAAISNKLRSAELELATCREMSNQTSDCILFVNTSGLIASANVAAQERFGAALGRSLSDCLQPLVGEVATLRAKEAWAATRDGETRVERFLVVTDGRASGAVCYEARFAPCEAQREMRGTVITFREDSQREWLERELRQTQADLAEAQAMGGMGSWEVELASGSLRWSDGCYRVFGFPRESAPLTLGAVLALVRPEDRAKLGPLTPEFIAGLNGGTVEYEICRPDGERRLLLGKAKASFDESGAPVRFYGVVQDITDIKNSEARGQALLKQLQHAQKMEALGALAGGIAHQFNNTLSSVLCYAALLKHDTKQNPAAAESVQEIIKVANRAKELTREIATFSGREASRRDVLVIQAALQDLEPALRAILPSTVQYRSTWRAPYTLVNGDAGQLQHVLLNLVSNAIEAIGGAPGKVEVTLDSFHLDKTAAQVSSLASGSYVRLQVCDSGPGMDRATLDRIFEPFFTTKSDARAGLGLAVVHGIVREHRGGVRATSEIGKGSTFEVLLPAATEKTGSAPPLAAATAAVGYGERILLVDDETPLLTAQKRLLEQVGFVVDAFDHSAEAGEVFIRDPSRYHAVVADQSMPTLPGLRLAEECKRLRPSVPFIITTGYAARVDADEAKRVGVNEILHKPVNSEVLAGALRRALDSKP